MDARALLRAHKASGTSASSQGSSIIIAAGNASRASPSQPAGTSASSTYASTGKDGLLRCTICLVGGVKYWDAHTASKQHKTSLNRVRAEAAKDAERRAKAEAKLKAQASQPSNSNNKRLAEQDTSSSSLPDSKRQKVEDQSHVHVSGGTEGAAGSGENAAVDDEFEGFLASLGGEEWQSQVDPSPEATSTSKKPYKISQPETQTSYEAAPILIAPPGGLRPGPRKPEAAQEQPEEEEEEEESEADRRARLDREEREEIMDRLEEEARAQEDADSRVTLMKNRLEAVKRLREERKKQKLMQAKGS